MFSRKHAVVQTRINSGRHVARVRLGGHNGPLSMYLNVKNLIQKSLGKMLTFEADSLSHAREKVINLSIGKASQLQKNCPLKI